MKLIIAAIYGLVAFFTLLCGWSYPVVIQWSYLAVGACGLYGVLSLTVAERSMPSTRKSAAWCLHGVAGLATLGLLLIFTLRQEGGWFLAAGVITGFTAMVTLISAVVLKAETSTATQRIP